MHKINLIPRVIERRPKYIVIYWLGVFWLIPSNYNSTMGGFDFSSILDIILFMMIVPYLTQMLSSFGGTSIDLTPIVNLLNTLLPYILLLNVFQGLFKGLGNFGKIFETMIYIMILPTLFSSMATIFGTSSFGSVDLTPLIDMCNQLVPIILFFEVIGELFNKIKIG